MATFKIEYRYYVGDLVEFKTTVFNGGIHRGFVQSLTEIPDVFVETVENGVYKRYRVGIDKLKLVFSEYVDSGTWSSVKVDKGEIIEQVHGGELGTKEFGELIYTRKK